MAKVLDGLRLPNHAEDGSQTLILPTIGKNYGLDGTLTVDVLNVRSGWRVTFPEITKAEYDALRAKYDKQFTDNTFLSYHDEELGVEAIQVFLNMPEEINIIWNYSVVNNLTIVLEPRYANSL
jgi:hypothetical protein